MPDAPRGAIFRDFFKEIVVRVEEERKLRRKVVHGKAAAEAPLHIFDSVAQSECQFLNRSRACLANVVAADRNRVELRSMARAEFNRVNHQAHRGLRRIDVFLLRDIFLQDIVLQRSAEKLRVHALFFSNGQIHRPKNCGGRIDRHGRRNAAERNLPEQNFHVGERTDGHAAFPDFSFGEGIVGVITHQCGQIEGDRKAGLSLRKEKAKTLVRILGRSEPGELTHGPEPAAIHRGVDTARVGRLAGHPEVPLRVPAG